MTTEQINIAIAEACGWKDVRPSDILVRTPMGSNPNPDEGYEALPDYTSDLNAMHEAEKVLTPSQWLAYHNHIVEISGFSYDDTMHTESAEVEWIHRIRHATAAQLAEAFLRTLSRWNESK